jgi:hypothetical protein
MNEANNSKVPWSAAVEILEKHLVRISTPRGSGTGFLLSQANKAGITAIATAAHVIDQSHYWEEPIRLHHISSGNTIIVHQNERAIILDNKQRDSAVLLIKQGLLPLPANELPLTPVDKYVKVGNEIGWLGFPAIPTANLCFFGGKISAWIQSESAYLVDGVAINGVSGGPAIFIAGQGEAGVHIIGFVSAYMPNRATGETLPGLSVVRDVTEFHEIVAKFPSFEQAQSSGTPPPDSPPPPNPPQ